MKMSDKTRLLILNVGAILVVISAFWMLFVELFSLGGMRLLSFASVFLVLGGLVINQWAYERIKRDLTAKSNAAIVGPVD